MTIKQRPEVHRHGSCYTTPRSWRPCSTAKKSFWRSGAEPAWALGRRLLSAPISSHVASLRGSTSFGGAMVTRPPDWRVPSFSRQLGKCPYESARQIGGHFPAGRRTAHDRRQTAHSPGCLPIGGPRDDQRVCRAKAVTLLATRTTTSSATAMSTMVPPGLRPR